ncbi:MAG: DUF4318 domain-containing protein [Oscillospiraceae bacterium]|nr:DUF4318 domain-containing protein [Oscillospiraceae bacterium]
MNKIQKWWQKKFSGNFCIELPDEYCYITEKNFCMPTSRIMCEAIEAYSKQSKEKIVFENREKPIVFILNDICRYTATLQMGYGRGNSGYHIACKRIRENEE